LPRRRRTVRRRRARIETRAGLEPFFAIAGSLGSPRASTRSPRSPDTSCSTAARALAAPPRRCSPGLVTRWPTSARCPHG